MDLYYAPMSSPCRAVLLTAESLGIELNLVPVDLAAGEQLQPEFEQLNPQKTVPLLVDNDYKLSESRAIMAYLVDQYGKNKRLYPENPAIRAVINERLNFDMDTLYKYVVSYYFPCLFQGAEDYDQQQYTKLKAAFEILDKFLEGQEYTTGRNMTIADLSLAASVSTAETLGFDLEDYKNVSRWMEKIKTSAPGYRTANGEGVELLKNLISNTEQE